MRARWLLAATVTLTLLVYAAVLGVAWRWYTSRGPHVRDDIATLDQAVTDALAAAGTDAAVTIGALLRARTCSIAPLRQGGIYTLTAELYVNTGAEDALIGRMAGQLPGRYHVRREAPLAGTTQPLSASAGNGVQLDVRQLGDGWIAATATTGCTAGPTDPPDPTLPPRDPDGTALTDVIAALHTTLAGAHRYTLGCPDGHEVVTVAAVTAPTNADRLADRLPVPAGARGYTAETANRVVYRSGNVSIVIAASDDNTAITAQRTTSC